MEWINLTEKRPNHKQTVLVAIPDRDLGHVIHVAEAIIWADDLRFEVIASSRDFTFYGFVHGVTHWMPLPNFPTSKSEGEIKK